MIALSFGRDSVLRAVFELCKSDNSILDHMFWNFLVLLGLLTVDSAVFDLYFFKLCI